MGGIPWLRVLLTVGCLLLALPAMLHLTGAPTREAQVESSAAPVSKPSPAAGTVNLALTFAHAPEAFTVLYLGKPIWNAEHIGTVAAKELAIPFPTEGVDLEIKAKWPAETPDTALRATLTPQNQPPIIQTAWGKGQLDAVLTFQEAAE